MPGFPRQARVFADLYYNRHRDYDPTTGRYIQAGPIGLAGGSNSYLYAGANPVNAVDPEGLHPLLIAALLGGVAGAGVEIAIQGYHLWQRDCDITAWSNYDKSDIVIAAGLGAAFPSATALKAAVRVETQSELEGNRGSEASDHTIRPLADVLSDIYPQARLQKAIYAILFAGSVMLSAFSASRRLEAVSDGLFESSDPQ
jgi:RHS repeat-associated protein